MDDISNKVSLNSNLIDVCTYYIIKSRAIASARSLAPAQHERARTRCDCARPCALGANSANEFTSL